MKDRSHILSSETWRVEKFTIYIDGVLSDISEDEMFFGDFYVDTGIVMNLRRRASDPPMDQHMHCGLYEKAEEICRKHFK